MKSRKARLKALRQIREGWNDRPKGKVQQRIWDELELDGLVDRIEYYVLTTEGEEVLQESSE